jgi:ankyrin repeat protein
MDKIIESEKQFLFAVKRGALAEVSGLLANGVDPHCVDSLTGRTALHFASLYKRFRVLKFLFESPVKIHCKDLQGETPLSLAAKEGHLEIVKFLIEHGAKLEEIQHSLVDTVTFKGHRYLESARLLKEHFTP